MTARLQTREAEVTIKTHSKSEMGLNKLGIVFGCDFNASLRMEEYLKKCETE